jgi:D-threo-aldose 1-dehydrogenase
MNSTQKIPPLLFGTSGLGNLFVALEEREKQRIVEESVRCSIGIPVFDSAGKYGAGLALECLGKALKELGIPPQQVIISNKLGWLRTKLHHAEPTFEPGVWKNLQHDAVQKISYSGIMECFEQGNELLNGYIPLMLSVHDPDEYLSKARDQAHEQELYQDILDAYAALFELKKQGQVQAIGVGAKNWKIIQRIAKDVDLDWIMVANSLTIKQHPPELLEFILQMSGKGVHVINSALFHSGFLVGSDYFDYQQIFREDQHYIHLYKWRDAFFELCKVFSIKPAEAAVQFGLYINGVKSIALNTTNSARVRQNADMLNKSIPMEFWEAMRNQQLIQINSTHFNLL